MTTTFKQQAVAVSKEFNAKHTKKLNKHTAALNDAASTLLALSLLPNQNAVLFINELLQTINALVASSNFDESTPEARNLVSVLQKISTWKS